jgi:aspartate/methionine/tyrosine aminotransferase
MTDLKLSNIIQDQINKPSPIRQIMKMADRQNIINMGLNPDDVISFGGGWVNHPAPDEMRVAYIDLCNDRDLFHKSGGYSPTPGDPECRKQLARYERDIFGLKEFTDMNIIIGQSSTQITHDMFITIVNPGEPILMLDPTYANYGGQIAFALPGSKIELFNVLDTENWSYVLDVKTKIDEFTEIFAKVQPKVTLIAAPDNPTSQNIPDELVKAMVEITGDAGTYLVIDHAYKTQYFGEAPPSYYSWSPSDYENLITLHSNSKWSRGLGRRLGWIEASPKIIDAMERTQQCTILCPDSLHQMVLTTYLQKALDDGTLNKYIDEVRNGYERAAQVTIEAIDKNLKMPRLDPQGGLYTCVKVGSDGDEFVPEVLKNTGVLFIPGAGFGPSLKEAVRISYGPLVNNLDKIKIGMERVGEFINK